MRFRWPWSKKQPSFLEQYGRVLAEAEARVDEKLTQFRAEVESWRAAVAAANPNATIGNLDQMAEMRAELELVRAEYKALRGLVSNSQYPAEFKLQDMVWAMEAFYRQWYRSAPEASMKGGG